ncbi:MAG: hypothetical protein JWP87_6244, partial [Labilithrix sp.]|nr:hypothetical protein [Labilithrix sp.]
MRIFGRSRIAKSSAFSAASGATAGAAVKRVNDFVESAESIPVEDFAVTEEMPIVREISPVYPVSAPDVVESQTRPLDPSDDDGDSDVFVCRRSNPDLEPEAAAAAAAAEAVTLFVYGWENVEPGPLSWAFPSLRSALDAVKTMRNAVEWCIVAGHEWASIDAARAKGAVLVEQ